MMSQQPIKATLPLQAKKRSPSGWRWSILGHLFILIVVVIWLRFFDIHQTPKSVSMSSEDQMMMVPVQAVDEQQLLDEVNQVEQEEHRARDAAAEELKKMDAKLAKSHLDHQKLSSMNQLLAEHNQTLNAEQHALLAEQNLLQHQHQTANQQLLKLQQQAQKMTEQHQQLTAAIEAAQEKLRDLLAQQQSLSGVEKDRRQLEKQVSDLQQEQQSLTTQIQVQQQEMAHAKNDAILQHYMQLVQEKIAQAWQAQGKLSSQLSCELTVSVNPDGNVMSVDLLRSSGDAAFDQSARAAVFRASPLPVPKDANLFQDFHVFSLSMKPDELISTTDEGVW